MALAQAITLVAATLTTGLVAGLLFAFAHAVMPGLSRGPDGVLVAGFQSIDRAIENPWMGLTFVGAPVLMVLAAGLQIRSGESRVAAWVLVALVLYGAVLAITFLVHLPMNMQIRDAGEPSRIADLAAVRQALESRWVPWNVVRAALSTAAFGCLTWSLVLSGGR